MTDTPFTQPPLKDGRELEGPVMLKELAGNESRTPRGSLRSLRVSSPVLTTVTVTLRFSNPSALRLEVDVLTVKLGVVEIADATETAATYAMRMARG